MGQVVVVVHAGRTLQAEVQHALSTIEGCPIRLMLLNKARAIGKDSYGYGYGYGYGNGYGYGYGAEQRCGGSCRAHRELNEAFASNRRCQSPARSRACPKSHCLNRVAAGLRVGAPSMA